MGKLININKTAPNKHKDRWTVVLELRIPIGFRRHYGSLGRFGRWYRWAPNRPWNRLRRFVWRLRHPSDDLPLYRK